MAESQLRLIVNGKNYTGWKTIDISRSIKDVSGVFSLEMTDILRGFDLPLIQAGDSCKIEISDGEGNTFTVMTGYVDAVSASMDAESVSFSVQGRDKSADIVDCSILGTSQWKDIKFEDFVAQACAPFGITVNLDARIDTGDKIASVTYDQGVSVFEVIAKYAQLKQLLVYALEDGSLYITQVGTENASDALVEGLNVISASSSSDWSEVFSLYEVKGSRPSTNDDASEEKATQVKAQAKDTRMTRYRPLMIIPDSEQKNVSAEARSQWEATTRIAKAEGHTVVRQGWQFVLNQLKTLELPSFGVSGDYLVESFRMTANEDGKQTEFRLVHPRSYDPLPDGEVKKDAKDSKLNNAT
tara:strand:- start:232 stop:1299 length:1068 start_codon:yes stop_codon:yes gene_type:complete